MSERLSPRPATSQQAACLHLIQSRPQQQPPQQEERSRQLAFQRDRWILNSQTGASSAGRRAMTDRTGVTSDWPRVSPIHTDNQMKILQVCIFKAQDGATTCVPYPSRALFQQTLFEFQSCLCITTDMQKGHMIHQTQHPQLHEMMPEFIARNS